MFWFLALSGLRVASILKEGWENNGFEFRVQVLLIFTLEWQLNRRIYKEVINTY